MKFDRFVTLRADEMMMFSFFQKDEVSCTTTLIDGSHNAYFNQQIKRPKHRHAANV